MPTAETSAADRLEAAKNALEIALPTPTDVLSQDEEWVVVNLGDQPGGRGWKKIRLHDYDEVFAVPGLYEKWIYDIFQCRSPEKVAQLLKGALAKSKVEPGSLKFLDLGAGNGCVAEELSTIGVKHFVGVDIYPEAADAAERDRPGLYDDYVVTDLTNPDAKSEKQLTSHEFTGLSCVAALGFGDIPTAVFASAFNHVEDGGWIAFTIKEDFLDENDTSGFSKLIRSMIAGGVLEPIAQESYTHRITADGNRLTYVAIIGKKLQDVALPKD